MYREDVELLTDKLRKRISKMQGNLDRHKLRTEQEIADMTAEMTMLEMLGETLDNIQPDLK
jgi:hypothetical protein